jgi:hypothetical protein
MSVSIAMSMPARAESDTQAPQLLSLTVGPPVDVSAGAAVVVVSAHLTDDLSGVASGTLAVNRPVAGNSPPGGPLTRVSGTPLDGVFQWSVSIPQFSAAGIYELALTVFDASGNGLTYLHEALGEAGFPNTLQVTGTSDTQAPQLLSLSFSPPSVDVSGGPTVVVASARMTDDRSGVGSAILSVNRSGPGNSPQAGPVTLVSGTPLDGVFQWSLTIPQYSVSGSYPVAVVIADASGNRRTYLEDELADDGFPNEIQVSGTSDTQAPQLLSLSVGPPVDVSAGAAVVVVSARLTDDLSGVASGTLAVNRPVAGNSPPGGPLTRVSGTPLDGVFQWSVSIPQFSAAGTYELALTVIDASGNRLSYLHEALGAAGFPNTLQVTANFYATRTVLSSSRNPSATGDAVMLQASVSPLSSSSSMPSGSVSFVDGATSLGTAPVVGGVAQLSVATLGAGSHSITAAYSGDAVFAASTSSPLTQVTFTPSAIASPTSGSSGALISVTGDGWNPSGDSVALHFTSGPDVGSATVDSAGHVDGSISVGADEALGSNPIILTQGTLTTSAPFTVVAAGTIPAAPVIGSATSGNAAGIVSYTAGADGGSSVTAFTVTCASSNGGALGSASALTNPITVSGLTNGKSYTCTVTATNSVGTSAPSAASNAFVPATVPTAPRSVVASSRNTGAVVSFAAPVSDGGSAIVAYIVTCASSNGGVTKSAFGAGSPITVSGLTNGKSYTCTVTATNSVGTGPASPSSSAFVPAPS